MKEHKNIFVVPITLYRSDLKNGNIDIMLRLLAASFILLKHLLLVWGELALIVVFLKNCNPFIVLSGITYFEKLHNKTSI